MDVSEYEHNPIEMGTDELFARGIFLLLSNNVQNLKSFASMLRENFVLQLLCNEDGPHHKHSIYVASSSFFSEPHNDLFCFLLERQRISSIF